MARKKSTSMAKSSESADELVLSKWDDLSEVERDEQKEKCCERIYLKKYKEKYDSYEDFIDEAKTSNLFKMIMEEEHQEWTLTGINVVFKKYLTGKNIVIGGDGIPGVGLASAIKYDPYLKVTLTERGKKYMERHKEDNAGDKKKSVGSPIKKQKNSLLSMLAIEKNAETFFSTLDNPLDGVFIPNDETRDIIRALSRRKISKEEIQAVVPLVMDEDEFEEGIVFTDISLCYVKNGNMWQLAYGDIETVDFDREMLKVEDKVIDCRNENGEVAMKPRKLYNLIMDLKDYLEDTRKNALFEGID